MDFLKNAKISTKLIVMTAMMGLLIVLSSVYGFYMTESVNGRYQRVYDEDAHAAMLAVDASKYFSQSQNEMTRYMYRADAAARQQAQSAMQNYDRELDTALAELEKRCVSDGAKKMINDTYAHLNAYRSQRTALMNVQLQPGTTVESLPETKLVHDAGDAMIRELDNIEKVAEKASKEEIQDMEKEIRNAIMISAVVIVLVIVAAMTIGIRFAHNIGKRASKMAKAAERIGNGDLTEKMHSDNEDEIGQAVRNFETMRQHLNQALTNIHVAADQVAAGSRNVSEASVSLSQGAAEQASSVEELSASISEISSQTASNAENASKANALTTEASEKAKIGDEDMQEMLSAMEAINTSSANISKIIKVIDEIAFQTNILALNAAVEAARAGQHGKGFAVVAEEVRNLAARSAKAAKETTELIEDSITKVESGRAIAGKTAEALVAIHSNVSEVADIVSSIAKASSEQKLALEQIDQGVLQVSQVVQANSATSEESASASEELSAQAARLKDTAGRFRLEEGMTASAYPEPAVPAPAPATTTSARPSAVKHAAYSDEEGFGKY